jgi:hypothetical protein
MSLTIYKAQENWPILQSLTETKHLSGLLSVSAEYIRPVGNQSLPTEIPTSIGNVIAYPTPTVSKDTSGFEKINATGYKAWDASISEQAFNISVYDMPVYYWVQRGQAAPDLYSISLPIVIESGWVKKIGDAIPTLSRALTIISPSVFSVTIPETGATAMGTPSLNQSLSMVKRNLYGAVTETEAAYEIRPTMNLGGFNLPG